MHFKNLQAALHVGRGDHNLTVKTAGAEQRGVKHVGTVGRRDEDDAFVGLKTVHFHKELVQGLFAFVMPPAEASATLTAHGVDFVDKDKARSVFLALHKQVTDTRSAHAHEHFHKVGTGNGEEGHARLTSHGAGQQGLTGTGRADEQDALGNAPAKTGELARIGEEVDDFGKFFLGFVHTGHVIERDLTLLLIEHTGPGTAKGHGTARSALHLAHEENPHADKQQHGEPRHQQGHVPRGVLDRLGPDFDLLGNEFIHKAGIVGDVNLERFAVGRFPGKGIPLNNHLGHFTLGGLTQEFTVRHARLGRMLRLAKQVEHNDHSQGDDPPEHEIPRKLIQKLPPYGPAAPNPAKPRAQCKFSLSV